jgi:hypothetical protein
MRLVPALALLVACTPSLARQTPQTAAAPPTAGTRGGAGALATKRVAAKLEPGTLIADDATRCEMRPETFAQTSVGAMVRCSWTPPARRAATPTAPGVTTRGRRAAAHRSGGQLARCSP